MQISIGCNSVPFNLLAWARDIWANSQKTGGSLLLHLQMCTGAVTSCRINTSIFFLEQ